MKPAVRADVWHATLAMVSGLLVFFGLVLGAGGVEEKSVLLLRLAPVLFAGAAVSDAVRAWIVPRILGAPRAWTRVVLAALVASGCLLWAATAPELSRLVFTPALAILTLFY